MKDTHPENLRGQDWMTKKQTFNFATNITFFDQRELQTKGES